MAFISGPDSAKPGNMIDQLPRIKHVDPKTFFLLAGPCAIEGEDIALRIAEKVVEITNKLTIPYVFKGSYRKANRSQINSFRGIGDEKALRILRKVGETFDIPTVTDYHCADEASMAAEYADMLQVPAFLCRQTDVVVAGAKTGKFLNIKKGPFLSPDAMQFVVQKAVDSGNNRIILTDRGTSFGYQDLIADPRAIPQMKALGFPVVMDVTHSLQQPNQSSGVTGGRPQLIETIARSAIATGADGIFLETHDDLANAKSDAASMLPLESIEGLLVKLLRIREAIL